jgi:tetratricopeptide (TPR) repeat protein
LALEYGRFAFAEEHFKRAGRAYSGYWLVEQHIADLLRAEGRFADAATVYSSVVATTHRPEHQQTLGDLFVSLGKYAEAKSSYDAALAAFLESADRGEVHYYHHLADYYIESRPDKARALEWAQKDVAVRRNYSTLTVLAWALYGAGRVDEALVASDEAVSTRIVDAEMLYQAAAINFAASRPAEGDRLLQFAISINPHMRTHFPAALFESSNHRQPVS